MRRDQRVLRLERHLDGWRLETSDDVLGPFDQVVLSLPARQTASLLTDGALRERLASVRYAPCLAVATKFPVGPRPRVRCGPVWPRGASYPGSPATRASPAGPTRDGWILHAAPDWSRDHLERDPDENTRDLLACFAERFDSPPPDETFAHRWRYALVETPLGEPCLADPEAGWIVCGDGCLGGRLEAAWDSGIAAAGRLLGEPPETAAQGVPGQ